jgi:hypothetical protein
MLITMTVKSPTDGEVFLACVEQVLCPRLHPGQIVVMVPAGAPLAETPNLEPRYAAVQKSPRLSYRVGD